MFKTRTTLIASAAALLFTLGSAGASLADDVELREMRHGLVKVRVDDDEQQAIRAAVARKEVLPLNRILAIAAQKVPGEVIKVELERESWGIKYEVKILTPNGRVREVELNARTGAVIKIEND